PAPRQTRSPGPAFLARRRRRSCQNADRARLPACPSFSGLDHGFARDIPIRSRHVLEDHPDSLFGKLRNLADRFGDAACDLILALLRVTLEDSDVHERHEPSLRCSFRCIETTYAHGAPIRVKPHCRLRLYAIGSARSSDG